MNGIRAGRVFRVRKEKKKARGRPFATEFAFGRDEGSNNKGVVRVASDN